MLNEGDEEGLLAKALYYQSDEGDKEESDLSKPPTSAQQYLRRVHREARQLKDVVVAEIDPKKLTQDHKYNYETRSKTESSSSGVLPSKVWQDIQLASFSQHRLKFHLSQKPEGISSSSSKRTEKDWAIFCFGSIYWNKLVCMDEDRGELIKEDIKGKSPLLSVLVDFKHTDIVNLLEYFVQWIEELDCLEFDQGVWLFSLLTLLVKPLHPDVISSLRSLALFCSRKRGEYSEFTPALNLFICLVAKYFGQADLSD